MKKNFCMQIISYVNVLLACELGADNIVCCASASKTYMNIFQLAVCIRVSALCHAFIFANFSAYKNK